MMMISREELNEDSNAPVSSVLPEFEIPAKSWLSTTDANYLRNNSSLFSHLAGSSCKHGYVTSTVFCPYRFCGFRFLFFILRWSGRQIPLIKNSVIILSGQSLFFNNNGYSFCISRILSCFNALEAHLLKMCKPQQGLFQFHWQQSFCWGCCDIAAVWSTSIFLVLDW